MAASIIDDRYPLSPMQQGMLLHTLMEPDSGVYGQQLVFRFGHQVDLAALERAWQIVVERHAILRTKFSWETGDEPEQLVQRSVELPFEVHDLRDLRGDQLEAREARFFREDLLRGFDIGHAPLLRIAVLLKGPEDVVCVATYHHALLDGTARRLVMDEFLTLYDAEVDGREAKLPESRPYRDYIDWLQQLDLTAAEAFWRERLAGIAAPTPLPTRPVPAGAPVEGPRYGFVTRDLGQDLTADLEAFAAAHELSLANLVIGAWAIALNRYSGEPDVVFGATRAGRGSAFEGAREVIGLFINTLPVRVRVEENRPVVEWLRALRQSERAVRPHEHTPLTLIQEWSSIASDAALFDSIIIFNRRFLVDDEFRERLGRGGTRDFDLYERTNFPLAIQAYGGKSLRLRFEYLRERFDDATLERIAAHIRTILTAFVRTPEATVGEIPVLGDGERRTLLEEWNGTQVAVPTDACIHTAFEAQVERTPDATAVVFGDQSLTYAELNERSNRVAHRLRSLGVGPEARVGIFMHRSADLVVALLGILKAGGAYLPLDPQYPRHRLEFMLQDAGVGVLVTESRLRRQIPEHLDVRTLVMDAEASSLERESSDNISSGVTPANLAYVIYTSGSTGKPKGVMVQHDNVINFFAGMDERIGTDPGTWLAVTSISFDISVLELFWTLTRGFEVIVRDDAQYGVAETAGRFTALPERAMDFSLFFFAADHSGEGAEQYRLLIDSVKFADEHGFAAVWTPERHFHSFGGLYPNPAVTSAALATITSRLQLRAGSCVFPLHDTIRIAEEWALVDNLSNGRVAVAVASGWHDRDFVFAPDAYENRHATMYRQIEEVKHLWRGGTISRRAGSGKEVIVGILPRPVQEELPIWITAAGSPDTFRSAGEMGASILTHLLGQTPADLSSKIEVYREAWRKAGHPGEGHVTLMIHTFVGDTGEEVLEHVRGPFTEYLRTSVDLIGKLAKGRGQDIRDASLSKEDMEALLEHAFERYYETSALFGTVDECVEKIDALKELGVNEVACLIDFGVATDAALQGVERLADVLRQSNEVPDAATDRSIAELIAAHRVTHMQCTPSQASMLVASEEERRCLADLETLLVGGEALPRSLATQLREATSATIINMYGPTETTIWSSTWQLDGDGGPVSIGRPIANTRFYVLDRDLRPAPIGVAGELYIGGAGVARGYLDRPDLTRERFVADPFTADSSSRLYRTGDLVAYRDTGELDFLGRLDHQVKLRGHRIELGEIETAINKLAEVREAVVIVHGENDAQQLVAYVVSHDGRAIDGERLRSDLRQRLPEIMVPATIVELEALPLTPNLKVDRKALPAPVTRGAPQQVALPQSDLETSLLDIWRSVLQRDSVGVEDNFFDVGGNSILTVRVHNELRRVVGQGVKLIDLFRYPTIRSLVHHLDGAGRGEQEEVASPVAKSQSRAAMRRQSIARRRSSSAATDAP